MPKTTHPKRESAPREPEAAAPAVNKQSAERAETREPAPRSGSGHLRAHTTRARRGPK